MDKLTKMAISASIDAGAVIKEIYGEEEFDIDFKTDNSPLTKADIASHQIILSHLESTGIPVLSEEGKTIPYEIRSQWKTLWIVDPIDGTKEFIKRNGEFTVNIALIENGIPVLGVIYVPALDELYFADKNIGSYKVCNVVNNNDLNVWLENAKKLPLPINRSRYTVVASRSHLSSETESFIAEMKKEHGIVDIISKGSSLKLCLVAEGAADCYPRFAPTMEWDTAAGHAICKYANRTVMDYHTKKEIRYNRRNLLNSWFLVK